MAQLLLQWLNNELILSRRVNSFAHDFDDGYLFGEIMYKYNQQVNFYEFAMHGNPSSKIHNFGLLEPTMNKIGVHFNPRIVTAIMKGHETTVKNLLYEMKSALERIQRNCRQNTSSALRGTSQEKVINVIKPSRAAFDTVKSATFDSAVRRRVENTNDVMMRAATQRFQDKESGYVYNMSTADDDLHEATMHSHLRTKEIDVSRKLHEDDFAEAWDGINLDQWKKNQRIAHDRRNLKKKVVEAAASRQETKYAKHQQSTRTGTFKSIREFESRLDANILAAGAANNDPLSGTAQSLVKTTANIPGDRSLQLLYVDQTVLREGFELSTKQIKEHHEDSSVRQHMHEQRRRRFLREYDTMQVKMSEKLFHSEVVAQILNFAVVEATEDAEMQKVVSYKEIIAENRSNRRALMDRFAQCDADRERTWQRVQAVRELHWAINGGLTAHQSRAQAVLCAKRSAHLQECVEFAHELLDKLLDVVDFVISCRSLGVYYYDISAPPGRGGRCSLEEKLKISASAVASVNSTATVTGAAGEQVTIAAAAVASSCAGNEMLPPDLWSDAAIMFAANADVCKELYNPVPLTVTSALWPFTISERPECASDREWLFSAPFHSAQIMNPRTDATAVEAIVIDAITAEETSADVPPPSPQLRSVVVDHAALLAAANTLQFIEAVNAADLPEATLPPAPLAPAPASDSSAVVATGTTATDSTAPAAAEDASTAEVVVEVSRPDELFTPTWLFNTQPRHILGEAIVAIRCAVQPLPLEPLPVLDTRHIPLRAALFGTSDLCRRSFASALQQQIPGLFVIEAAKLVHDAYSHQINASATAADDNHTDTTPTDATATVVAAVDSLARLPAIANGECKLEADESAADVAVDVDAPLPVEDVLDSEVTAPAVIVEDFAAVYEELSQQVLAHLVAGRDIPDELYVQLLVHYIKQIPERNNGYVLQDFPTNKKQALLLMEALSGIRYDSHKPQADDHATVYAPCREKAADLYDISKCGFDLLIYVDNGQGIKNSFYERSRARLDTNKEDVPLVYISDEPSSVVGLLPVEDPERPSNAVGIDLAVLDESARQLVVLSQQLNLFDSVVISEQALLDYSVKAKAAQLCERFIPPENLLPGFLSQGSAIATEVAEVINDTTEDIGLPVEIVGATDENLSAGVSAVAEDVAVSEEVQAGGAIEGTPDSAVATADSEAAVAAGTVTALEDSATTAAQQVNGVSDAVQPLEDDSGVAPEAVADSTPATAEVQYDSDGNPILAEDAAADESAVEVAPEKVYVYQLPVSIHIANAIPPRLADALLGMWNLAEQQSQHKSNHFFNYMRDVRYQMTQRRRCAFDCLSGLLVRLDNRQQLFDAFRERFNAVEDDMRFDPDCIAELHLQTLELCDNLTQQSETRKAEGEAYALKMSQDNVVKVLLHRCRCEAAAMLQSEWQRFYITLHVIFDYTKSVKGFQMHEKILNELEETLPIVFPSGDASGKGKKDKGKEGSKKSKDAKAMHDPYREPLGAVFLPKSTMQNVPAVNVEAEVDAKGKKKDKKAVDGLADAFAEVEGLVLPEVGKWRRGQFSVSRVLYEEDEPLSKAVEQAVWYEAEKLLTSVSMIKSMLSSQLQWLETAEAELAAILFDMVNKRFFKELAAVNYLVEIIEQCIEEANSVSDLWLVSPDSIPVDPISIWNDFYEMLPEAMRAEDAAVMTSASGDAATDLQAMQHNKSVFTTLSAAQLQSLAKNGVGLSKEMLSCLAAIGNDYSPAQLAALAKAAEDITIDQLSLFVSGDVTPDQLVALMNTVRKTEDAQSINKGAHIYTPEHSKEALSIAAAAAGGQRGRKAASLSEQLSQKTRVSFGRPSLAVIAPPGIGTGSGTEDAFSRQQQKYQMMRKKFEDKLQKRRHARENEFKSMGMSPATAKLAAYNELLLEEQHELADFDSRYKPRFTPKQSTSSKSKSAAQNPSSRQGRRAGVRKVNTNTGVLLQVKQRQQKDKDKQKDAKEKKRRGSVKGGGKSPKAGSSPSNSESKVRKQLGSFDESEETESAGFSHRSASAKAAITTK